MTSTRTSNDPMTIAGVMVADPLAGVLHYLANHPRTVECFDLTAGSYPSVTPDLIVATRRPYMNSRISRVEGDWFVERARVAAWDSVDEAASLVDADPCEVGKLYDDALALYLHFFSESPKGVSTAKVSKVLHLMRPHLFPILDSRLLRIYAERAELEGAKVRDCRSDLPAFRRSYWAAIRLDVIENASHLARLRIELARTTQPLAAEVATRVADLRLLDMLTWPKFTQQAA